MIDCFVLIKAYFLKMVSNQLMVSAYLSFLVRDYLRKFPYLQALSHHRCLIQILIHSVLHFDRVYLS